MVSSKKLISKITSNTMYIALFQIKLVPLNNDYFSPIFHKVRHMINKQLHEISKQMAINWSLGKCCKMREGKCIIFANNNGRKHSNKYYMWYYITLYIFLEHYYITTSTFLELGLIWVLIVRYSWLHSLFTWMISAARRR